MSNCIADYTRADLAAAIEKSGVKQGDVVFSHSGVGFFGLPAGGATPENVFNTIYGAFRDVLGSEGTLVVPTFTYSPGKGEIFDPKKTPSTVGVFTEMVRKMPEAHRSLDPIFSVAAVGRLAHELTYAVSPECFGRDSFWQRFLDADGITCNLNRDSASTFLHYCEKFLDVPYRFDKHIPSEVVVDGVVTTVDVVNFCWNRDYPESQAYFVAFDKKAREEGVAHSASVGKGAVVSLRARDALNVFFKGIEENPCFLTRAAEKGKVSFSAECLDAVAKLRREFLKD